MFRAMRRSRQCLPAAECRRILEQGKTGILAVCGDGGYPYTVPLNYVYAEGRIYFHCATEGHKLDAIRAQAKVSFCVIERDEVVPETLSTDYRSVVLFGRARILERPEEIRQAARLLGLKYCPDEAKVEAEIAHDMPRLACVEIVPEHVTGKEGLALSRQREKD